MNLVQSIPGLQATTTVGVLAEVGTGMSRFPSDKHLAAWAGVCPGNKQSAGKRLSGKTTKAMCICGRGAREGKRPGRESD